MVVVAGGETVVFEDNLLPYACGLKSKRAME